MLFKTIVTLLVTFSSLKTAFAQLKIMLTNDDGWAAANIRAQYNALTAAGFNVVLSAPAENESGTGSLEAPPTPVLLGCEFNSCPALSPSTGKDKNDPRLNYVNSFPVTSLKYGIQKTAPPFFGGTQPDFVFSGPNVGGNTGLAVFVSGTVGAASEGAKEGFTAVAFSGAFDTQVGFQTLSTPSASTTAATVYGALGVKFVNALFSQPYNASSPALPAGVLLNVNYPNATGACTSPDAYKFVLSRVFDASILSGKDVDTCGSDRLPTESDVVKTSGCFASVSVVEASSKLDSDATTQAYVLQRLGNLLTCLP